MADIIKKTTLNFIGDFGDSATLNIGLTESERRYFQIAGVGGTDGRFIVTQQFKDLASQLNGAQISHETLVLKGPKGVGKSATLGALATLCRRPCILYSIQVSSNSATFREYFTALYGKYQDLTDPPPAKKKSEPVTCASNESLLVTFLRDFKQQCPILLCDISGWTKRSDDVLELAGEVLMECSTCPTLTTVVAHSSGTGSFPKTVFRRYVSFLDTCPSMQLVPFTDAEAEVFMQTFRTKYLSLLPMKAKLKTLTNYNPSLLIQCFNKKDIKNAIAAVTKYVRFYIDDVKTSLQGNQLDWVQGNILFSMEMLYYAENDMMVEEERYVDYLTCWVAAENLTYIVHRTEKGFWLRVNHPPVYAHIMEMFRQLKPQNNEIVNGIVKGYQFENRILQDVRQLVLVYNKEGDSKKQVGIFNITLRKKLLPNEPLTNMNEGILYHLRDKHPVIDAVGIFKEKASRKEWLLMVQVSLSSYTRHKSKAVNLLDSVTGPENFYRQEKNWNWLQYYSHLGATTSNRMYIYICPDEIHKGQLPSDTLADTGDRSRTKGLFLGLVEGGTETSNTITSVLAQL